MRPPRHSVMSPITGVYVQFYCEACSSPFNSAPDLAGGIVNQVKRSLFNNIPVIGGILSQAVGQQPVDVGTHFSQIAGQFRDCPGCSKVVCLSCFDAKQQKCSRCRIESSVKEVSENVGKAAAAVGLGIGAIGAGLAALSGMAAIECPACKKSTLRGPRCQNCGAAIPESVYRKAPTSTCPQCKTSFPATAKFCPGCGSPAA